MRVRAMDFAELEGRGLTSIHTPHAVSPDAPQAGKKLFPHRQRFSSKRDPSSESGEAPHAAPSRQELLDTANKKPGLLARQALARIRAQSLQKPGSHGNSLPSHQDLADVQVGQHVASAVLPHLGKKLARNEN